MADDGLREKLNPASRLLLTAPASGSGKTLFTCALIALLKKQGISVSAAKCGPDYIDPMFHRKVAEISVCNLDTYLASENMVRYLLMQQTKKADFTLIEGVMGYYDGLGGNSERASAYEVAKVTKTPVVLVVDAKGASVSLAATIRGMMEYRADSSIAGILLNRVSKAYYPRIKEVIERECAIPVLGFLPEDAAFAVPSRHLGLISPEEMADIRRWADTAAEALFENLDLEKFLEIAGKAECLTEEEPALPRLSSHVKIGVARDEAFSFYYQENLDLLRGMGAEIVMFSPLHDGAVPDGIDGLLLGGGYPELFAEKLSENLSMRGSVAAAVRGGMPTLAECGGFLYLQEALADRDGTKHAMCGVLPGEAADAGKLCRFGYIQARSKYVGIFGEAGVRFKGHEFHHWDSTENGDAFLTWKPKAGQEDAMQNPYDSMQYSNTLAAGFPHFYYPSNPSAIFHFLEACVRHQAERLSKAHWDAIAKPIDGLGLLEKDVTKLCGIFGSPRTPNINQRALLIFCADHGAVAEGVSQTGSEVTKIVAENFAHGSGNVSAMARVAGVDVFSIDAGMDTENYPEKCLRTCAVIDRKIARGTKNLAVEAAMTLKECEAALQEGMKIVAECKEMGYNILATGEMGIGNTTPTSALAALFLNKSVDDVTGVGAGLDAAGLARKRKAITKACERVRAKGLVRGGCVTDAEAVLAEVGGFEIAMMAGVCLGAVKCHIPVVLDGAISCVAALVASKIDARVPDVCLASHVSKEATAPMCLLALGLEAKVHADMHLGEGTGAMTLIPLLDMAIAVYDSMASFADLDIAAYERQE